MTVTHPIIGCEIAGTKRYITFKIYRRWQKVPNDCKKKKFTGIRFSSIGSDPKTLVSIVKSFSQLSPLWFHTRAIHLPTSLRPTRPPASVCPQLIKLPHRRGASVPPGGPTFPRPCCHAACTVSKQLAKSP